MSGAETWSLNRSLALLAAIFSVVLGALMPFAAMAAAVPGHPIVLCSVEGPRVVQAGGATEQDPDATLEAGCAACLIPAAAVLPAPIAPEVERAPILKPQSVWIARPDRLTPPSRAPPRPPSTAPPHA